VAQLSAAYHDRTNRRPRSSPPPWAAGSTRFALGTPRKSRASRREDRCRLANHRPLAASPAPASDVFPRCRPILSIPGRAQFLPQTLFEPGQYCQRDLRKNAFREGRQTV